VIEMPEDIKEKSQEKVSQFLFMYIPSALLKNHELVMVSILFLLDSRNSGNN